MQRKSEKTGKKTVLKIMEKGSFPIKVMGWRGDRRELTKMAFI